MYWSHNIECTTDLVHVVAVVAVVLDSKHCVLEGEAAREHGQQQPRLFVVLAADVALADLYQLGSETKVCC